VRPEPGEPLVIERVIVGAERIEALVRVTDPLLMRTSAVPGLAETILELLPGLARHRCECGSYRDIHAELADTETAHLLEHVTLELMALSGSPRTLRGDTHWDFARDGRGVFRVSLEFDDDLVALGALREGVRLVAALVAGESDALDADGVVERLVGLRGD